MADIEREAFKRDRRFLVRLVVVLIIGIGAFIWLFAGLTNEGTRGCAAEAVGGVADEPRSE